MRLIPHLSHIFRLIILGGGSETSYGHLCALLSEPFQRCPSITVSQDLDGDGAIGFEEVCGCTLSEYQTYVLYAVCAFVELRGGMSHKMHPFLSDIVNSNGGKFLIHLTSTMTAELMPPSWAKHWPSTSMLAFQSHGCLSLTSLCLA